MSTHILVWHVGFFSLDCCELIDYRVSSKLRNTRLKCAHFCGTELLTNTFISFRYTEKHLRNEETGICRLANKFIPISWLDHGLELLDRLLLPNEL